MPRFSSQNSATPAQSAGSRWFREIASAITSVVFPAGCRICEKILASSSRIPICEACLSSFTTITEINCEICGRPSETGLVNSAADPNLPPRPTRCHDCLDLDCPRFAFQRARSWALYHEALISAILLLKFERIQPLGYFFAERLAEMICSNAAALEADIVVPVPLHRARQRSRGYNQADLLARPLARKLRLPYKPILLARILPRPEAHLLTHKERWASVRGAFATRPGTQVDNLRVLLVDDVMTTGATLDSCARALRKAGAQSVIAVTVARASMHQSFTKF